MYESVEEFVARAAPLAPETALISACRRGVSLILNPSFHRPTSAEPTNTIRAELIRLLLSTGNATHGGREPCVIVRGAWISGALDLSYSRTQATLVLLNCHFDTAPMLDGAEFSHMDLSGSAFPGLHARAIRVRDDLLMRGIISSRNLQMERANVGGQLNLAGSSINDPDARISPLAIEAQGITIGESLGLADADIFGSVELAGAKIGGQINAEKVRIWGPIDPERSEGPSLDLRGSSIGSDLLLPKCALVGKMLLIGARLRGSLKLNSSTILPSEIEGKATRGAIVADHVKIDGNIEMNSACVRGLVSLSNANILGSLICKRARLQGDQSGKGGYATSLQLQGSTIGSDVNLDDAITQGTVALAGTIVKSQLSFLRSNLDGSGSYAIFVQNGRIEGGFIFVSVKAVKGAINLRSAYVSDLVDDAASWELCTDGIHLDGFTFDRISGKNSPRSFEGRKVWLENGSRVALEFFPQPYLNFARYLRSVGREAEARKVLIALDQIFYDEASQNDEKAYLEARDGSQAERADMGHIWLRKTLRRWWSKLMKWTTGYGHKPERALFCSAGLILFGALLYFCAYKGGLMVPNSDVVMVSDGWQEATGLSPVAPTEAWAERNMHYETFYALIYAADVYLPIIDLGQETAWTATTVSDWGVALRWFTFMYELLGWTITTLGLAAAAGFVQRRWPD